jgi:hypothetical protein
MDAFDNLEQKTSSWIISHKKTIFLLIGIFLVVFTLSMVVTIIGSYSGWGLFFQNYTESYNAGRVPEQYYKTTIDYVLPFVRFALDFLGYITGSVITIYLIVMSYFIVRWAYRRKYQGIL